MLDTQNYAITKFVLSNNVGLNCCLWYLLNLQGPLPVTACTVTQTNHIVSPTVTLSLQIIIFVLP